MLSVFIYVEKLSEYSPCLRIIQILNPMAKSYIFTFLPLLRHFNPTEPVVEKSNPLED